VHRFTELNTTAALTMCMQDLKCWLYCPDHWAKAKARVDRQFLWTVLASIQPEYTKAILDNAYQKRWAITNQEGVKQDIMVCERVANAL
jgi:hypothetical protein